MKNICPTATIGDLWFKPDQLQIPPLKKEEGASAPPPLIEVNPDGYSKANQIWMKKHHKPDPQTSGEEQVGNQCRKLVTQTARPTDLPKPTKRPYLQVLL